MKFANFSKVLGATLLAAGISVGTAIAPAQAQLEDNVVVEDELIEDEGLYEEGYYDDGFDWGWLGLLGLIGLAGLAGGRKRRTTDVYTEPVDPTTRTSTTDYRR